MNKKPAQSQIQQQALKPEQIKLDNNLTKGRSISQKEIPSPLSITESKKIQEPKMRPKIQDISQNYYQQNQQQPKQKNEINNKDKEEEETRANSPLETRALKLKPSSKKDYICQIKFAKVIRDQKQKLILRPNGNIVLQKEDLGKLLKVKLYINTQNYFSLPYGDFENNLNIIFEGFLNSETFLPECLGKITSGKKVFKGNFQNGLVSSKQTYLDSDDECTQICSYEYGQKHGSYWFCYQNGFEMFGQYGNNKKQGAFEIKKNGQLLQTNNYINDVLVEKNNQNILPNSTRYLFTHKEYSINNWAYEGLDDGNWLNQLTVDYFIQLLHDYFSVVNKKKILLITTILCQDIFSSQITKISEQNIQLTPETEQQLKMVTQYDRVIFVMNVDRGHFVVLVYQNNVLYMLNSLPYNYDTQILDKVSRVFKQKPKTEVLPVAEQQNGYDCGVHSIYNVMLQYKYIHKHVKMIDYKVTKQEIRKWRNHIKNVIIGDYVHLIK